MEDEKGVARKQKNLEAQIKEEKGSEDECVLTSTQGTDSRRNGLAQTIIWRPQSSSWQITEQYTAHRQRLHFLLHLGFLHLSEAQLVMGTSFMADKAI